MQASAARTPAPPTLEMIATLRPAGGGWVASRAAASVSSPSPGVAMIPACSNSAWRLARGVATAAVCEAAACCPAAERPACTVSTGIWCATRRAVRANLRGLPNDSMYKMASRVTPSCSHHSSMSLLETSSLLPTDANEEMPMPSRDSWPASAKPSPPDCVTSPAVPGCGWVAANVASRPEPGTAMPKQFGPTRRIPWRRQIASKSADAGASSPAVITTMAFTPLAPQASATSMTPAGGMAITARSGASGNSATVGTQRTPPRSRACGLTAYRRPS